MARIINLDDAIPEDIQVVINGETYLLPGDIPVPDLIAMDRLSRNLEKEEDGEKLSGILEEIHDQVIELFRVKHPELNDLPVGANQLFSLIMQVYRGAPVDEPVEEGATPVNPTKPATRRKKTSRGGNS